LIDASLRTVLAAFCALVSLAACAAQTAVARGLAAASPVVQDYARPGPHAVLIATGTWRDAARNRDVPYLIRYPADVMSAPVVVFSHGLGGTERGAAYYSDHLASQGFAVAHVRHLGSDASIWGGVRPTPGAIDLGKLRAAVADPRVSVDRFLDIPFALTALGQLNDAGPMKGRFDLKRVGVSGHSFGAVTTQVAAGQVFQGGIGFPALGVRAFLAMSPSGARDGDDARAFARVTAPFMFMTGTEDSFGVGNQSPAEVLASRRRPFETVSGPPTYLATLTGGDHFVFSGRQEMGQPKPSDSRHQAIVNAAALAFFRAYLMDDAAARAWLDRGELAAFAGADARVERKAEMR